MNQDIPYSNRELDHHFEEIKKSLERIEIQTTKTNGRVTRLELWKQWIAGIAVLGSVCCGLLGYIYTKEVSSLEQTLNKHIEATTKILVKTN